MKLVSVTWSYENESNVKDTILYKSFIKHNDESDFVNIHFNRSKYWELETEFQSKFGYQYEFLLYRIFLLSDWVKLIGDDVLIFSDTTDVVCLGKLSDIEYNGGIIFSAERHQYPNDISSWGPVNCYPQENLDKSNFLNAGLQISEKGLYLELLRSVIDNVFPLEYKTFGGDQGVYIYYLINEISPKITLDVDRKVFVSTYLTSPDWYRVQDEKLLYNPTNSNPFFVHDNGWNYGSPKIIERYRLI